MNRATLYVVDITLFIVVATCWSEKNFHFLMSHWYVFYLCNSAKFLRLCTNLPQDVCVFNWLDFSALSDTSTYQYNYSNVNHVERQRQRICLLSFVKGALYSVLFMGFLNYKVKFVVHHYHVIGLSSVCFSIVCSCSSSQEYLIGLLTQMSLCNSPPLFSLEMVPNSMEGSK